MTSIAYALQMYRKKVSAVVLISVLLLTSVTYAESIMFNSIADDFHYSSKEWLQNEEKRTLLTSCLILDAVVNADFPYNEIVQPSGQYFVGGKNDTLEVGWVHPDYDEMTFIVFFNEPATADAKKCGWYFADGQKNINPIIIQTVMKDYCKDGIYEVSSDDIKELFMLIMQD